jgi:putative aminopeptidase FrvX
MDFSLLKRLTETPGISGQEDRVRNIITDQLCPITSETTVDR